MVAVRKINSTTVLEILKFMRGKWGTLICPANTLDGQWKFKRGIYMELYLWWESHVISAAQNKFRQSNHSNFLLPYQTSEVSSNSAYWSPDPLLSSSQVILSFRLYLVIVNREKRKLAMYLGPKKKREKPPTWQYAWNRGKLKWWFTTCSHGIFWTIRTIEELRKDSCHSVSCLKFCACQRKGTHFSPLR